MKIELKKTHLDDLIIVVDDKEVGLLENAGKRFGFPEYVVYLNVKWNPCRTTIKRASRSVYVMALIVEEGSQLETYVNALWPVWEEFYDIYYGEC